MRTQGIRIRDPHQGSGHLPTRTTNEDDMSSPSDHPAVASGTFTIGGDLPVHRLGYGAMQLTGPGVWGEPADRDEAIRVLRRAVALYRVGIHNALGTPDEGVPYARSITPAVFPTAERQARYWTDTARMWHPIGNHR